MDLLGNDASLSLSKAISVRKTGFDKLNLTGLL